MRQLPHQKQVGYKKTMLIERSRCKSAGRVRNIQHLAAEPRNMWHQPVFCRIDSRFQLGLWGCIEAKQQALRTACQPRKLDKSATLQDGQHVDLFLNPEFKTHHGPSVHARWRIASCSARSSMP